MASREPANAGILATVPPTARGRKAACQSPGADAARIVASGAVNMSHTRVVPFRMTSSRFAERGLVVTVVPAVTVEPCTAGAPGVKVVESTEFSAPGGAMGLFMSLLDLGYGGYAGAESPRGLGNFSIGVSPSRRALIQSRGRTFADSHQRVGRAAARWSAASSAYQFAPSSDQLRGARCRQAP